jgi:lysophospholipase L1-like esterase
VIARGARLAGGIVVALALFAVSGEILARALGMVERLNGYSRLLYVRGPDSELPYLLRPGTSTQYFGVDVRVNAEGFRGPEQRADDGGDAARRVLLLGDSIVFGQGLPEEATLAPVLAARLHAADGGRWEVVNAGVPGYDGVAEARLLDRVAGTVRPADVVVGMSLNDTDPPARMNAFGVLSRSDSKEPTEPWLARSEFALLLQWVYRWSRGELPYQQAGAAGQVRLDDPAIRSRLDGVIARMHRDFYASPDAPRWQRLVGGLEALRAAAARSGVRLLVVIFPESWQLSPGSPDRTPQERLLRACSDAGVRCLDLHPAFAAAGGDLFLDVQHPNAAGDAVAAAAIADALLDRAAPAS